MNTTTMTNVPLPDVSRHTSDPGYLKALIDRAGLAQTEVGKALGIPERTIQRYVKDSRKAPYVAQYAIECYTAHVRASHVTRRSLAECDAEVLRQQRGRLQRVLKRVHPTSRQHARLSEQLRAVDAALKL